MAKRGREPESLKIPWGFWRCEYQFSCLALMECLGGTERYSTGRTARRGEGALHKSNRVLGAWDQEEYLLTEATR